MWVQLDEWEFVPFNWGTDFDTAGDTTTEFFARNFSIFMTPNNDLYCQGHIYGNAACVRQMFISRADAFSAVTNPQPVTVGRYTDQNPPPTRFKYIGMYNYMCILEETDTKYVDFRARYPDEGGKDFSSYFLTGAKIPGQGDKTAHLEYLSVFANAVTNGTCKMRAKWDWSNDSSTGKWSTEQEVYSIVRTLRDVSRKRLLVRGSGPALQLHFRSVSGQPFDLIGWTAWIGADGVT